MLQFHAITVCTGALYKHPGSHCACVKNCQSSNLPVHVLFAAQWSGGYLRALEAQQLSAAQPESLLGWKIKATTQDPHSKNLQHGVQSEYQALPISGTYY